MAESEIESVLKKIQPAISLFEETINLGLDVIKGLMDEITCSNWSRKLLIRKLAQLIGSFSINPTEI